MGRSILAVIVGFVAMSVFVVLAVPVCALVLGVDGVYRHGSYEVSATWLGVSVAINLLAAMTGGWLCARLSPRTAPLAVLIVITLGLGLILAPMNLAREDPGPRKAGVEYWEAVEHSQQPAWFAWLTPFVGAVGLYLGGSGRARKGS